MKKFMLNARMNSNAQATNASTAPNPVARTLSPAPHHPHPVPFLSAANPNNARFDVFISHAGEDKVTIAIPLREKLQELGITAFVDMKDMRAGTEAEPAMIHAMETAKVGVIIMSPEFVARKWPMKELMHFLKRRDECMASGRVGPTIIPFFYRLSISQLYDEPRLDRTDKDGNNLFEMTRFYERQRNGESEASVAEIKAALRRLHGIMGLENFVNASNDNNVQMTFNRKTMLHELVNKICEAVPEWAVKSAGTEQEGDAESDSFRAHFDMAHNVSDLVFDFEERDSYGNVCTPEGRVLEMLLDRSADRNRAIAVRGISGVGKTCLLRKIRSLRTVFERFQDGVYSMELGKHATRGLVIEALILAVTKAGGRKTAKEMRTETDMGKVMDAFRSWFAGKQSLFVIDDVWETKEVTSVVIHDLWNLHANGGDSKTLLTTRSRSITADGKSFCFLRPRKALEAESRAILYHYAMLKPEPGKDEDNKAVDDILRRCMGLPLLLGVAGKSVKTLSLRVGHSGCLAYRLYADQLKSGIDEMLHTGVGSHAGLWRGLKIAIELVNERKEGFGFDVSCSIGEMHRRLSVLQKQMRVPMTMLRHLWEVENESQAARIAREFEQVGLAEVEYEKRESDTDFAEVLQLHDSVHDFALYETKRSEEGGVGHRTVLEGYGNGLKTSGRHGEMRGWWSEDLEDDKYIHVNICRHLVGAGFDSELFGLLLSPKWLGRQADLSGVRFVENDFSIGIDAIQKSTATAGDEDDREVEEALMSIRGAIRLSLSYISENVRELWFQVQGRLKRAGEHNKLVREYASSIMGDGLKPRMLCENGFLIEPGGPNAGIIYVASRVNCMVLLNDGERVACGCTDGVISIVNVHRSEMERKWEAHKKAVTAMNAGNHDTRIVSASRDMTGKIWDRRSGLCIASFDGFTRLVTCVAMSPEANRVVCGYAYGSFQICEVKSWQSMRLSMEWDSSDARKKRFRKSRRQSSRSRPSGRVRDFLLRSFEPSNTSYLSRSISLKSTMRCMTVLRDADHVVMRSPGGLGIWNVTENARVGAFFDGYTEEMSYVAMAADESRLVGVSVDGVVRLWNVEGRQLVRSSFEGHKKRTTCVTASPDACRIASGSLDDEAIRVWDTESGEQVGGPLIGHTGLITGVSFLGQGDRIVSCSEDGTVRVWNLTSKSSTSTKRRNSVWSVSFSPDGKFGMCGSSDGLRMWDANSGRIIGEPFLKRSSDEDFDQVYGVAITPDGRFAVSVSSYRVHMWDLQTRKCVASVEHCTGHVSCVAVTPDGKRVVTGSSDRTVRVWNLNSGLMDGKHFVLEGHGHDVRNVFVSDDGKRIISVDFSNEIYVWDLEMRTKKKQTRQEDARLMSRRQVLNVVGEGTVHDEAGVSIRRYSNQIVHGEGSEARVLGTLDTAINDWDISPDKRTICVGLSGGQIGLLKLEL